MLNAIITTFSPFGFGCILGLIVMVGLRKIWTAVLNLSMMRLVKRLNGCCRTTEIRCYSHNAYLYRLNDLGLHGWFSVTTYGTVPFVCLEALLIKGHTMYGDIFFRYSYLTGQTKKTFRELHIDKERSLKEIEKWCLLDPEAIKMIKKITLRKIIKSALNS